MALTDRDIKNFKTDKPVELLFDGRGLYLRCRATGLKTFTYRYKHNNKTIWLDLGTYPNLSLAEARTKAQDFKNMRLKGIDPHENKKVESEVERKKIEELKSKPTFNSVYEKWFTTVSQSRKDSGEHIKRNFEKDVLPYLSDKIADEVTRRDVAEVVDRVLLRGSKRMANLTLSNIKAFFNYAESRELVSRNPAALLKKSDFGGKETERTRVLSEEELKDLVEILPAANLHLPTYYAIYIVLSTSCRIGELTNNTWSNVNFENQTFFIPEELSKNGKKHTVYLSPFAIKCFKLLESVRESDFYLFPNKTNTAPIYEKALGKQLRDRQLSEEQKKLEGRSKLYNSLSLSGGKWTFHDLRRTSSTIMRSVGVSKDVVEACLNHTEENKMSRVYDQYEQIKEMKSAWLKLGKYLEKKIKI